MVYDSAEGVPYYSEILCLGLQAVSKKQILLSGLLALATAIPASAAPMVLACHLRDGMPGPDIMNPVDQIIIDQEMPSIEFRVSNTIGTKNPVNWLFKYRDDGFNNDTLVMRTLNGVLNATGFRDTASVAFAYWNGVFTYSNVSGGLISSYMWLCRE